MESPRGSRPMEWWVPPMVPAMGMGVKTGTGLGMEVLHTMADA